MKTLSRPYRSRCRVMNLVQVSRSLIGERSCVSLRSATARSVFFAQSGPGDSATRSHHEINPTQFQKFKGNIMKHIKTFAVSSLMLLASCAAVAAEDTAFLALTDGTAASVVNSAAPLTPVSVNVVTELKVDTTIVTASRPSVPSIDGFWVVFSGPTWTKAVVAIQVTATGELEKSVTLVYAKPAGFTGTFYAPFAISDWTGSTSGAGTATVTFYNGAVLLGGANHTFTLRHN